MYLLQIWLFVRSVKSFFKKQQIAKITISLIFLLLLAFLFTLFYFLGKMFASFIFSFGSFSDIIFRFLLISLVSSVSVLSLISFFIVYLRTFFAKKLFFYFLLPKKSTSLSLSIFLQVFFVGVWPLLVISLPFFFGLSSYFAPEIIFYLKTTFLHFFLGFLIAGLSGSICLLLVYFIGKKLISFLPLFVFIFLFAFFIVITKFVYPANLNQLVLKDTMAEVEEALKRLPIAMPFLPTTNFVDGFLGVKNAVIFLFSQMVLFLVLFLVFTKIFYKKAWQKMYEGFIVKALSTKTTESKQIAIRKTIFSNSNSYSLAFLKKEILFFKRNSNALIYLSFIVFISSVFSFFISLSGNLKTSYEKIIPVANLSIFFTVSYLILLFVIRFVFPVFALESKYLRHFITTQKSRLRFSFFKWMFSLFATSIFAFLLSLVVILWASTLELNSYEVIVLFVTQAIILTVISLTIGQLFRKFLPQDDVEEISTTIPGIFVTIISLIIGLLLSFFVFYNHLYLLIILLFAGVFTAFVGWKISDKVYQVSDI